ncbi:MAG: effector binding domain-containing protein [Armatimonadota bacterium]
MSEPMRKPGRSPESYNPKKPEIANMMQKHANLIKETVTMADFDVRVVYIPPMIVAASHATGENCEGIASNALNKFVMDSGLLQIEPDIRHFGFDCSGGQSGVGEASHGYEMWVSIPDDMEVPAPLIQRTFHGGLYAAHTIKMGEFDHWNLLREWVRTNGKYLHDWGAARWTPFEEGMEHCLEEQLNFTHNMQNPTFDYAEMQLDLLFPIQENTP